MKKLNKNNILASRRGFSMMEVVIGLTIIIIVSAASLTLILQHSKAEINVAQTIEATNVAENAIECFDEVENFDEAENREKFEQLFFTNIYGEDFSYEADTVDGVTTHTYKYKHKAIDFTIVITENKITITALGAKTIAGTDNYLFRENDNGDRAIEYTKK